MDPKAALRQVDLDQLLGDFGSWQQYTTNLWKSVESNENEMSSIKKDLGDSREREGRLKEKVEELMSLVGDIQGTLSKRCDMEAKNSIQQKEIEELKRHIENEKKEHNSSIAAVIRDIEDMKESHTKELEEQKIYLDNQAALESDSLQESLEEKARQIDGIQQQLSDLEKEKDAELVKLRMEYESKLLRLQKQSTKVQQTQMGAQNQDIFRKKLQHAKAESEREIAGLKRNIQELQQKLTAQQQRPSNNGSLSMSKKRRF